MKNTIEKKLLFTERNLTLFHYSSTNNKIYEIPILLVPPLMISNSIFDLTENHSLAKTLAENGFRVYLIDFGTPDQNDRNLGIDKYVLDLLYRAVFMTKKHAQSKKVSLYGFCLGGTFSLAYASTSIEIKDDVENIVSIASPVDFNQLKFYKNLIHPFKSQINFFVNQKGYLSKSLISLFFNISNPVNIVKRYYKTLININNKPMLNRYKALSKFYKSFTNLPAKAFTQMQEVVEKNSLMNGDLNFLNVNFDFTNFKCNLLTITGTKDTFIPSKSTTAIYKCITSKDTKHIEVPLGHLTILGSLKAKDSTWKESIEWLKERSGVLISPETKEKVTV